MMPTNPQTATEQGGIQSLFFTTRPAPVKRAPDTQCQVVGTPKCQRDSPLKLWLEGTMMLTEFLLGLLGNAIVGAVFVGLAWWKTDALAARFAERRRVQQWSRIGEHARFSLKRAAVFCHVNLGLHGTWWGSKWPMPAGFQAAKPGAWAELLGTVLQRRNPATGSLWTGSFRSEYEANIVYVLPSTRGTVIATLRKLDRVMERYAQALPIAMEVAVLNMIAALEMHAEQVRTFDHDKMDDGTWATITTNVEFARRTYQEFQAFLDYLGPLIPPPEQVRQRQGRILLDVLPDAEKP
jgi:hypothetical protein